MLFNENKNKHKKSQFFFFDRCNQKNTKEGGKKGRKFENYIII